MVKIFRRTFGFALLAAALVSVHLLEAQQSTPAAPIPAQILAAKKIFISNAGAERDPSGDLPYTGGPDRPYNQFYNAIKTSGKYDLVSTPGEADLVFEIGLIRVRDTFAYNQLRLLIRDPKTNTMLWTFVEHASAVGRQKSRDAAFDRAMGILVDNVRKIGTRAAADNKR